MTVISVFYIRFFFSVLLMGNKLVLNFRQVSLIKIHLQMTPYKVLKSTVVTLPPKAEQQYYFSTKKKLKCYIKNSTDTKPCSRNSYPQNYIL